MLNIATEQRRIDQRRTEAHHFCVETARLVAEASARAPVWRWVLAAFIGGAFTETVVYRLAEVFLATR